VERAKGAQRIHVPVQRTEAAARHFGTDQREHLLHFRRRQHLHPVVSGADLIVHARDKLRALSELVLAEGQVKAAILLQGDVEPGLIFQFGGEPAPGFGRPHGPAGVGRHAEPLALHPDEREVCPRGALGDIALVENDDLLSEPAKAPGDSGAEQAAAHDGDVIFIWHRFS
jgi:hypothetical protein